MKNILCFFLILCSVVFPSDGKDTHQINQSIISDRDIDLMAIEISNERCGELEVTEIVTIIEAIHDYLETHTSLDLFQRKEVAKKVFNKVIDITDTVGAPDFLLDPLFKLFTSSLVDLMYPNDPNMRIGITINHHPTDRDVEDAITGFFSQLQDGFTIDDIPRCISYSVKFFSIYNSLSREEKASAAKKLLAKVIDVTDTPYLPDFIFDDLFKKIGNQVIDYLLERELVF